MHDILGSFMIDSTDRHGSHFFDVNCKICTGKMVDPALLPEQPPAKKAKKIVNFGGEQTHEVMFILYVIS